MGSVEKHENVVERYLRDTAVKQQILNADFRPSALPIVDNGLRDAEHFRKLGTADALVDVPVVAGFTVPCFVEALVCIASEHTAHIPPQICIIIPESEQLVARCIPIDELTLDLHVLYYSIPICRIQANLRKNAEEFFGGVAHAEA